MANEKRLIDANALKQMFDKREEDDVEWYGGVHIAECFPADDAKEMVDKMPTVDAVPVVHGRWEVVHGVLTPGGDPLLRCPICKSRESEHLCGIECRTVWHYCPNCGAKMDGDGNGTTKD